MLRKVFALLLIIQFQQHLSSLGQASGASNQNAVVQKYNTYLNNLKLNNLIKATDFSYKESITKKGNQNTLVTRAHVMVLTIEPAPTVTDTLSFISYWNSAKTADIYAQLFSRLMACTNTPADSLVIDLKLKQSRLFSFMIYFDKEIKVVKPLLDIKGGSKETTVDLKSIDQDLTNGTVYNIPEKSELPFKIKTALGSLLSARGGQVEPPSPKNNPIVLKARYTSGPVSRFHERISIKVILTPSEFKGYVQLLYSFNVDYAGGGSMATPADINYKDAAADYYEEMSKYKKRINDALENIYAVKQKGQIY